MLVGMVMMLQLMRISIEVMKWLSMVCGMMLLKFIVVIVIIVQYMLLGMLVKLWLGFLIMYIRVLVMMVMVIIVNRNSRILCWLCYSDCIRMLFFLMQWVSLRMWNICRMCSVCIISRFCVLGMNSDRQVGRIEVRLMMFQMFIVQCSGCFIIISCSMYLVVNRRVKFYLIMYSQLVWVMWKCCMLLNIIMSMLVMMVQISSRLKLCDGWVLWWQMMLNQ